MHIHLHLQMYTGWAGQLSNISDDICLIFVYISNGTDIIFLSILNYKNNTFPIQNINYGGRLVRAVHTKGE